ncbi:Fc receptor-like protein 5 isoform 1 precursor [Homo sapiens]|uniref:Fc receptor-like protein 5 n=1 Tax=Homo sapiens TaxID=9606 RepID=FCRL5_HUMAN|nr:Fc receptor-like protein 5 isoform 1 precursor [Homo sapiens]Q96RD9.3 RecName: Full=Fc receptor-like protein 5; Short=FcR-like protein 5; Short=FcRL5; AltName: Full=BXMAS1; AltName: Full=Fc receptor homolog 5; Short=FcRH5; AltName: Full=Immune receptor translocation-associated protein 2; AltName: CD_antigen=CD307e; Flags: Precursor [Homo sapiens]|eukprot:NP_112571.2 Fc receptor-like protein 5 isoform 1 precursor [Homo sapiens]
MLLWVILLVLAPVSGQFARTPRPIIFLQPPWTTVFQGERVTLTCKGFRFYSPQKTKWYHRYLGKEILRETPDNILEVQESGEYRCQAQGSPLSSPVHLDFSSASLILQAPLSVFEGDSVVLRCRAKAEVTLNNTIYKNDNVLAFLNKRTDFHIPHACLKDNGAYRCTGYKESCCPVSSNTVKIQVQEPFTRPVLRASSFQPISGNPVTLTCETQLSLERSDVPLRFRFFRDDQTLGLGWSLSPNFQITAMWSKDSGFYWCKAATMPYSVISDSPRSWIQVQIPASHPVLTLSPEKALNFEGTKVTLHCETQEDSLRTLYRFYHEGVPLRHKSVRCERGASISFSLTTENSGNYYCTADNGLGAKPSKAVSLSVTVPVSHPVLNLSSPEDLIFEGAKVTLHCEAQRGSLPILYQFHHEGAALERRSANSAGGVAISFSLTAEHSGNYYCTADNGFGPQRSKAVSLSVTVPVSHPVLTLSSAEALTFEGATVTLHCEVQRGSPQILYQFYHEDMPLWSSSTPSVGRVSFSFSLTEGHSGNYYCTADNGFGPQRSEVVSLFVTVPVSRPILTLRVPRAQAVVGDLLELHCEAPRGSPPILYWFYHEDVTLGSSSAPSGGEASFNLSLTAEHSGNYSCEANNGLVAQHSDTISLSVIVPVSRPILTFRAPRAQAVVGDLLELHCEALRGSSPILYWFYHEDVTLGKISAPSGGGASFNLSLTTEHSGIYSCEADNGLEAQRSEMVTLKVAVPVSRPVLTLRAPGTHAAVGDLLELHCEALRGSPLILYRFFHEDVTLGNRSSPSGGASLNLSLTAEHSGNYSCEADNGLGAQRSETVTLYITGLTANRSGPFATGVAGGLLSIAGLAAGALLLYCWLSRKAGRKPASDPARSPSDSDSQEPTYHNVPAWEELQPVYTNANPRGENVVYSEVRIIQEKKKHAVASDPRHLRNKGSPIIYSEVKVASTPVSGSLFLASSAPHR